MILWMLLLLLILVVFGFGFTVQALWWVAAVLLVVWLSEHGAIRAVTEDAECG